MKHGTVVSKRGEDEKNRSDHFEIHWYLKVNKKNENAHFII